MALRLFGKQEIQVRFLLEALMNVPEFIIRVLLPRSSEYNSSPSGDCEYEDAYNKAISESLPSGFEVIKPRLGHKWAVDSEGFTYVRIKCVDKTSALDYWINRAYEAEKNLAHIEETLNAIHR